jgi:quercetin dioxygenase-like cupin family protein
MKTTRITALAALIVGCGLALHVALAQQPAGNGAPTQSVGGKRTELQRHDLSTPGREVVQVRVEIGPIPIRHTHPGEEIVYVLQGSIEYQIEGKPPATLKAGDVLFIPAGAIHAAKSVGGGVGEELATYIVEKGKPLITLIK